MIEVKNKPGFQFVSFWGFLTVQLFLLCLYSIFLRSGLSGWQVNEITAIQVQKQGKRKCFLKNFYYIPCISKRVCLTGKSFIWENNLIVWGPSHRCPGGEYTWQLILEWYDPVKLGDKDFSFHAGKFKFCFASGQRFGREREQAFTDRVCEDKKWRIQPFLQFPASLGCVSLWGERRLLISISQSSLNSFTILLCAGNILKGQVPLVLWPIFTSPVTIRMGRNYTPYKKLFKAGRHGILFFEYVVRYKKDMSLGWRKSASS